MSALVVHPNAEPCVRFPTQRQIGCRRLRQSAAQRPHPSSRPLPPDTLETTDGRKRHNAAASQSSRQV